MRSTLKANIKATREAINRCKRARNEANLAGTELVAEHLSREIARLSRELETLEAELYERQEAAR